MEPLQLFLFKSIPNQSPNIYLSQQSRQKVHTDRYSVDYSSAACWLKNTTFLGAKTGHTKGLSWSFQPRSRPSLSSTTMFTFTSLLGAQSESAASQSLLELDGGVKILVDVGWDESLDADKLVHIEQ